MNNKEFAERWKGYRVRVKHHYRAGYEGSIRGLAHQYYIDVALDDFGGSSLFHSDQLEVIDMKADNKPLPLPG